MTTTKNSPTTSGGLRVQHISDVHLGARRHSRTNPTTGEATADESVLRCWESAVQTGIANDADAIMISGDLFDVGRPSAEMIGRALDPLREAIGHGIKIIAEDGNHGRHGVRSGHRGPAELLRSIGVDVYDQVGITTLETKSGPLHMLGVPWPERARLMHAAGADDVPPEQMDDVIAGYVMELIDDAMDAADIATGERLVVSSHITISDASLSHGDALVRGSETVVNPRGVFEEIQLPLDALTGTGADYIALGHIHQHQDLAENASYAGSLDRLTFGEAEDAKGTLLVDLTDDGPVRRFEPTPARRLMNLRLDLDPHPDLSGLEPGTLIKPHLPAGHSALDEDLRKAITAAGCTTVKPKRQPVKTKKKTSKIASGLSMTDAARQWAKAEKLDEPTTLRVLDRINTYL